MTGPRRNEGIIVTGGRIDAGALAVGRGARAEQVVHQAATDLAARGQAELAQALEELIRRIDEHAAQLANAGELKESAQVVAEELTRDEPNRTTVTGVLAGIAESVKSVAGVAAAAQALVQAVATYL
ncbi:hypothetical protein AB0F81_26045 [Actinoplanes sp. NPDC024001]|uniref:hypothetical protein n=1 Tax=Actinoplanes sp. NPDC024001 TaxID=3154598 RepID=UPI0033E2E135